MFGNGERYFKECRKIPIVRLFATILLGIILTCLVGMAFVSCKAPVTVSSVVDRTDSTDTKTENTTVKKDSASYRYEVLLRMLNRAQTTIALTRNQVDDLYAALDKMPKGTTIIKEDPKMQARLEILLDSMGVLQMTCVSNERYYTERITEQTRYIHELETKLNEKTTVSETNKETVKEKQLTFWQKIENFFKAGGTWLIILFVAAVLVGVLKFVPKIK
jgi:hypothetical protein